MLLAISGFRKPEGESGHQQHESGGGIGDNQPRAGDEGGQVKPAAMLARTRETLAL